MARGANAGRRGRAETVELDLMTVINWQGGAVRLLLKKVRILEQKIGEGRDMTAKRKKTEDERPGMQEARFEGAGQIERDGPSEELEQYELEKHTQMERVLDILMNTRGHELNGNAANTGVKPTSTNAAEPVITEAAIADTSKDCEIAEATRTEGVGIERKRGADEVEHELKLAAFALGGIAQTNKSVQGAAEEAEAAGTERKKNKRRKKKRREGADAPAGEETGKELEADVTETAGFVDESNAMEERGGIVELKVLEEGENRAESNANFEVGLEGAAAAMDTVGREQDETATANAKHEDEAAPIGRDTGKELTGGMDAHALPEERWQTPPEHWLQRMRGMHESYETLRAQLNALRAQIGGEPQAEWDSTARVTGGMDAHAMLEGSLQTPPEHMLKRMREKHEMLQLQLAGIRAMIGGKTQAERVNTTRFAGTRKDDEMADHTRPEEAGIARTMGAAEVKHATQLVAEEVVVEREDKRRQKKKRRAGADAKTGEASVASAML